MKFYSVLPKMNKKGQALIIVYMLVATFTVICAVLVGKIITERDLVERYKLTTEAFYLAEGGVEDAIASFTQAIANFQISRDVSSFNKTTTFSTFGGATVTTSITRLEENDRIVPEGESNIFVCNYEVTSTAIHPQNNTITVTVHQIIARKLSPAFQYFIFYDGDLEVLPGPNMTMSGKIHSNSDIYIDSNNTLTVDSTYLHSAGDIYNRRLDSGGEMGGDVSIRVNEPGPPQYESMNNLDSDDPNWTTESTTRWKGTVQSAVHGTIKRTTPSVASIQTGGYYASEADVVVVNNGITKNGVALVEGVDCPVGVISTSNDLYNQREDTYIKTVDIDLNKLGGYAPGDPPGSPSFPNNLPSNGLLFATRNDAGATYQPGVRLINGQEIHRNDGLTVVSNAPVYVQGDYNITSEKSASVICDSLNLLSNSWNDSKNPGSGLPSATPTIFNSAFIAGTDTTTAGNYNGGLENYPRLHENWSGKQLSIKGSFIALWESSVATGEWDYGSPQYRAPQRNWEYNTAFNNPANLPPFTPWAIEAERIAWWKD